MLFYLLYIMKQKNIIVPKTARYFILGEPSEKTETIWFVCHGYAQTADYFIKNFEAISNEKNLIIAPEGLHRFYRQGTSGLVVASWMTSKDREQDITDYVNYLNEVYEEVLLPFKNKKIKINVLGFSQGTASVCRWIADKKSAADNLILWAGGFPPDLNFETNATVFHSIKTYIIAGNNDNYITEEKTKEHERLLNDHKISFHLIRFNGKHEMQEETLINLSKQL